MIDDNTATQVTQEAENGAIVPSDTTAQTVTDTAPEPDLNAMQLPAYLVIDTETNDVPDFKLPADADGQARLAELVMCLVDENFNLLDTIQMYVRPDGWSMQPAAAAVNGLTTEQLLHEGTPIALVLEKYVWFLDHGVPVIAHNAQFDCKIMRGELRRAGMDDRFMVTRNVCTMRAMTNVCQIPAKNGRGFKWPKLSEAYQFATGIPLVGTHTAAADATACIAVAAYLKKTGNLPEPTVHLAKGRE